MLANKWVLFVLGVLRLADRPMRFGEVQRSVEGVTQKSLTKTLRALERDGLVIRRVFPTVPLRVEYSLTDLGREAGPLLTAVHEWAKHNATAIAEARASFDARGDEDAQLGGTNAGSATALAPRERAPRSVDHGGLWLTPWRLCRGGVAPGAQPHHQHARDHHGHRHEDERVGQGAGIRVVPRQP